MVLQGMCHIVVLLSDCIYFAYFLWALGETMGGCCVFQHFWSGLLTGCYSVICGVYACREMQHLIV